VKRSEELRKRLRQSALYRPSPTEARASQRSEQRRATDAADRSGQRATAPEPEARPTVVLRPARSGARAVAAAAAATASANTALAARADDGDDAAGSMPSASPSSSSSSAPPRRSQPLTLKQLTALARDGVLRSDEGGTDRGRVGSGDGAGDGSCGDSPLLAEPVGVPPGVLGEALSPCDLSDEDDEEDDDDDLGDASDSDSDGADGAAPDSNGQPLVPGAGGDAEAAASAGADKAPAVVAEVANAMQPPAAATAVPPEAAPMDPGAVLAEGHDVAEPSLSASPQDVRAALGASAALAEGPAVAEADYTEANSTVVDYDEEASLAELAAVVRAEAGDDIEDEATAKEQDDKRADFSTDDEDDEEPADSDSDVDMPSSYPTHSVPLVPGTTPAASSSAAPVAPAPVEAALTSAGFAAAAPAAPEAAPVHDRTSVAPAATRSQEAAAAENVVNGVATGAVASAPADTAALAKPATAAKSEGSDANTEAAATARAASIQAAVAKGVAASNALVAGNSGAGGVTRPAPENIAQGARPAKRVKSAKDSGGLMRGWQSLLERSRRHPQYVSEYLKRFQMEGKTWCRPKAGTKGRLVLGLDCEMVYAKDDPNALARVSVVSVAGSLLDVFVQRPAEDVLDYRTEISGVEPRHLLEENGAVTFEVAQAKVLALISPETILVGHALQNDLRALRICHLKIVDTALLYAVEGKSQWRKHKLHSLVSLMKPKVATLQSVNVDAAHDSRQDAEWAFQLALYEASIFPRRTAALKLESFPVKVFLSEIPQGASKAELKAIFGRGVVSDVSYQLQEVSAEWQGSATVAYNSQVDRDAALVALARFVCVHVGPLRDWAGRRDISRMQGELVTHFGRFGRVRGCRVFRRNTGDPGPTFPVAQLDCHPATARALLTTDEAHYCPSHQTQFSLSLAKEDPAGKWRRCVVPLGSGSFVAKIQ